MGKFLLWFRKDLLNELGISQLGIINSLRMVFMYSPFGGYSFANVRMKDFDFVFADKRICLLLRSNRTTNVSLCKCALPPFCRWGYYTTTQNGGALNLIRIFALFCFIIEKNMEIGE